MSEFDWAIVKKEANVQMIKDGLLPTIDASIGEIDKALLKLDIEDRIKTKRKFRKIFRRIFSNKKTQRKANKRNVVEGFYLEKSFYMVYYNNEN